MKFWIRLVPYWKGEQLYTKKEVQERISGNLFDQQMSIILEKKMQADKALEKSRTILEKIERGEQLTDEEIKFLDLIEL